jgi:hypothetical protein
MNVCWFHIQYSTMARGTCPSSLLHDHCHGCRFVEQPQLPFGSFSRIRIPVDTTVDKNVMNISDEGSDVSCIGSERDVLDEAAKVNLTPLIGLRNLPFTYRARSFL